MAAGDKRKSGTKLSPSRRMALDAVAQTRERGAYLQYVLDKTVRSQRASREDKAYAELLATGVVSTFGTLDELIDRNLESPKDVKPNVRDALRVSAYELLFVGKPHHVVVDQGVELARYVTPKVGNLANAVLRKMVADSKDFPWGDPATSDEALARRHGFPLWLAELLVERFGRDGAEEFMRVSNEPAPVFLAVNSIKATPQEVMEELEAAGAAPKAVGPSDRGCILVGDSRKALKSRAVRENRAIVTDASAQLTALAATPIRGKRFLEVGSGRGTKTVLLQSNAFKFNGEQAQMACVDLHAFKNGVLQKRISDCGLSNIEVFEGDATKLDSIEGLAAEGAGPMFGKVLIDAPCSGLGTLRRHPEIRWKTSPSQIGELATIGLAMLQSAASFIEPGGQIVYSTCTITHEENEGVVEAFLASEAGRDFAIEKVGGRDSVMNSLESGGADVHFFVKLKKMEQGS